MTYLALAPVFIVRSRKGVGFSEVRVLEDRDGQGCVWWVVVLEGKEEILKLERARGGSG